jgi:DNA-binding CsgD family transcriptional regulator
MRVIQTASDASHAVGLKAVIDALQAGLTFLATRDASGCQRLFVLEPDDDLLWIGRGTACDVCIAWDAGASRCHAELQRVPEGWAIIDDGLSRNGTFVGGERISGRRRLHDGEIVRCANSTLTYRLPAPSGSSTRPAEDVPTLPQLTPMQHKVLMALCGPVLHARGPAAPASNPAIAADLVLSTEAIKTHMRALFAKFGVEDLPQNQKRTRLVELAMQSGLASPPTHLR